MSYVEHYLCRLQLINPNFGTHQIATILAAFLVVGLVFAAPVFAWFIQAIGVPIPLPLLVGVIGVGAAYILFSLFIGRFALGVGVAFVVTSTFAANVPLLGYEGTFPGDLGPQIWLLHLPMGALIGLLALRGEYSWKSITYAEVALGSFVLWSAVSALVGDPVRSDAALYYSLYMLNGFLALGVGYRCVQSNLLGLSETLTSFVLAVYGHVAFGFLQFINQHPFGFTFLGETSRPGWNNNVVNLGLLGEWQIGVIVSGLTGGNGPLSVLIVIALPISFAFAYRNRGAIRGGALAAVVLMAVSLRITGKDAARGAAFIAIFCFVGFILWKHRTTFRQWGQVPHRSIVSFIFSLVVFVSTLLYPSSATGSQPTQATGGGGSSGSGGSSGIPKSGGSSDGIEYASPLIDITTISIPYFNLATLGVRFQQYILGLNLFFRRPILGIGGANFPYIGIEYGLSRNGSRMLAQPIHNLYISLLTETGLPGFIFYISAVAIGLWKGWQLCRAQTLPRKTTLTAGILAGLIGYLAVLFWVINLRVTYLVPFWLLIGILIGTHRSIQQGRQNLN